jgi:hypothetical protein
MIAVIEITTIHLQPGAVLGVLAEVQVFAMMLYYK